MILATMTAVAAAWLALAPPADPPIRSDGFGYHLWLRAIARGRLDFCGERAHPKWYGHLDLAVGPPSPATGRCAVIYPPGVALTKAPFVLPWVERRPAKDPGPVEQAVTSALPLVLIGLILQAHLALLEAAAVEPRTALFAAALATFGTGLFHYASFDAGFSHVYSAFWATMLVATVRLRRRAIRGACTAACASMLVLTRNTNLLLLPLVAVLQAWLDGPHGGTDAPPLRRTLATAGRLALAATPGVVVQLGLNAWFEGRLAFSSYWAGAGTLAPSVHHALPILWSYERGIVTYYPALPVMIGATIAAPATRATGAAIVGTLLGYVLLYSSWSSWTLGQGFGHRGFVEMAPLVALPCAVALDRIARRRAVALLGAGAIVSCTFLMTAYWIGAIPFGGTTPAQYWDAVAGAHLAWTARLLIATAAGAVGAAYLRTSPHDVR